MLIYLSITPRSKSVARMGMTTARIFIVVGHWSDLQRQSLCLASQSICHVPKKLNKEKEKWMSEIMSTLKLLKMF